MIRPSFFHHLHPPTIPAPQARWRYTLGAGGISVLLVGLLFLTGLLEMFYYVPTPEAAGTSIQTLAFLVPFGALIRNLHYLSGQILVVVVSLHLLRVIFTGAYTPPRRFNYLMGLVLFVLLLFLDFSGYILRWDQGIHWALVTGTNLIASIPWIGSSLYHVIVGGPQLSGETLLRFYAWHIFGLTLVVFILIAWHIFRVRRDGGISVPPLAYRQSAERITRFELVRRESLATLLVVGGLILLAVWFPAPIAAPLNEPASVVTEARAPWFFLWVQQMLKLGNPFVFGVLFPLVVLGVLILIPYVFPQPRPEELGCWFPRSARLAQVTTAVIVFLILGLTLLAYLPASPA